MRLFDYPHTFYSPPDATTLLTLRFYLPVTRFVTRICTLLLLLFALPFAPRVRAFTTVWLPFVLPALRFAYMPLRARFAAVTAYTRLYHIYTRTRYPTATGYATTLRTLRRYCYTTGSAVGCYMRLCPFTPTSLLPRCYYSYYYARLPFVTQFLSSQHCTGSPRVVTATTRFTLHTHCRSTVARLVTDYATHTPRCYTRGYCHAVILPDVVVPAHVAIA